MLNKLKELRESREEGFTLIELLVVIVIIGVLAAIALPIFLNQQKSAIAAGVKSDVKGVQTAVATYLVKKPTALNATIIADDGVVKAIANKSDTGTTLTVTGDWNNYKVTGTNSNAGGSTTATHFKYEFDSATGKYQTFSNGGTTAD